MADLARNRTAARLSYLLFFRAAIASGLLCLTLAADALAWPLSHISALLYAVSGVNFGIVLALGLLLRSGAHAGRLAGVHVVTVMLTALMVVQATGGVRSTFTSFYLLAILDGAIISGQALALGLATIATCVFGGQLVLQWAHVVLNALGENPSRDVFISSFVSHLLAFYTIAYLSGHLAQLVRDAGAEANAARHDLQRAEQMHAEVLAALPVGVLALGDDDNILMANDAAARILGVEKAHLLDVSLPSELAAQVAPGGRDVVYNRADGSRNLGLFAASLRRPDASGAVCVVVITDRTDMYRLEQALRQRERLATVGQMSAAIAHELRNPLAAIVGCIDMMKDEATDRAARTKMADIVLAEIDRLNKMVHDLLTYARPSALQPVACDLVSLANEVCRMLAQDSAWEGHPWRVIGPPSLYAEVDVSKLRQVLYNLLKNACEASPADGAIEVHVAERDAQWVQLAVIDRGHGMAPDVRSHLFEPFYTDKPQGTGLGLAVVYNIVEAHHGRLEVDSGADGTAMRVVLPKQRSPRGVT